MTYDSCHVAPVRAARRQMKGVGLGEALQLLSVVLVILAAVAGFVGTKLSDRGYVATFKLLASEIRQSRTPVAPQWSAYQRIVSKGIPTGGVAARATIQIELESDDIRVPLMARVAANAAGDYATTVSGRASVVDQLLVEDATCYVSVAHPSIRLKASVLGWTDRRGRDQ